MEYFCLVIDIIAVIVAGYALWDVRKLFQHLEERDRTTERNAP
jgi:hypothetical protein